MTDTTDIAALLEKLNSQTNSYDTVIIRDFEAKQLVAAFEAERQRADELAEQKAFWVDVAKKLGAEVDSLKAEFAALKGDQVPVAWRMWPEGNYGEGFIVNHDEDPVEDPTATDANGQRWISSPLYDRPQKPVVLPLIEALKKEIAHAEVNDIRLPLRLGEAVGRMAVPVEYIHAAIEAAGGEVAE